MRPVSVRIMHVEPGPEAGPLTAWLAGARAGIAERHRRGFLAVGAADVRIIAGPADVVPFGARLRAMVEAERPAGLVVLGSGSIPLATVQDRRQLVAAAGAEDPQALANDRYSADVVAVAHATDGLGGLPDLATDNALPRWLAESAGYAVTDLRRRWRLTVDLDSPLDLVLTGVDAGATRGAGVPGGADARRGARAGHRADPDLARLLDRIETVRATAADRRMEVLVAGRTSAATLRWLERGTASRTRALVEERGLRTSVAGQRPPASVLGALLERDGPASLGGQLARFADAAIVDSRVLLAHRLGADERAWPTPEDRFASDLLEPGSIRDPWLRSLTESAVTAPIPVLLGGHTLVGPGIRLLLGTRSPVDRWR